MPRQRKRKTRESEMPKKATFCCGPSGPRQYIESAGWQFRDKWELMDTIIDNYWIIGGNTRVSQWATEKKMSIYGACALWASDGVNEVTGSCVGHASENCRASTDKQRMQEAACSVQHCSDHVE